MSWILFISSGNEVTLNPEWDFEMNDRKVENIHRGRSGRSTVYKWGSYKSWKFSVSFVTSRDMSVVNSWWNTNAELLFMESGVSGVYSVRLMNKDLPVGRYVKPYTDKFMGIIELETY